MVMRPTQLVLMEGKEVRQELSLRQKNTGSPQKIKAIPNGKFILVDKETGFAPENITVKRVGKDLHVSVEGDSLDQPTIIIEDFFLNNAELIGMAENGAYYPYISSDGDDNGAVAAMLLDGESSPLVLGGEQLPSHESNAILGALGILGLGAAAIGAMLSQGRSSRHTSGKSDMPQPPADPQPAPGASTPVLNQLIDNQGSLQGAITRGADTDDNTPTFLGSSGTPGNTIVFYDNGKKMGETQVGQDGRWSFTPREPLTDGSHSITMVEQNADGAISKPSDAFDFTVDTLAPAQPAIGGIFDDVGSKTGPLSAGGTTDDTQPTLSGQAEAGATVTIYDNGQKIGEVVADTNGHWSFTPAAPLADGSHNFTATAIDAAGNTSDLSGSWKLVIDTSVIEPRVEQPKAANPISEVIDDQGSIQGSIAKGGTTDDTTPTLKGQGEPGDTIIITDNGKKVGETTVDQDGNWKFTPKTELGEGEHEISVIIEDKAGNQSKPSDPRVVIVDTSAPDAPTIGSIVDDAGNKTGAIKSGEVTDDNRPTINGEAEAGSTVIIYDQGKKIGETQTDSQGNWSFTPDSALNVGNHAITAKAIDAAGNVSDSSSTFDFSLIAPHAPSAPSIIAVLDDVGSIQGPQQKNAVTDDTRPTLMGTSEPGTTISIYNNGELLGSVVADTSGQWSFTPENNLPEGLNNLSAQAMDAAGNLSPKTGDYPLIIDTTPPAATESGELLDDVGNIQGPIANGSMTDDAQPTFHGETEPHATIVIYDKGIEIGRVTSDGDGVWSFTPDVALTEGDHSLSAQVIDRAGNAAEIGEPIAFTVDTRLVDVSIDAVQDDVGVKQGPISKGGVTDDATPTFSGRAFPDSTVVIYDKGVEIGSVQSDASGQWSFTPLTPLLEGSHAISATVTTVAGGESSPTPAFDFNIDITAPGKPGNDGDTGIGSVIDDVGAIQGPIVNGGVTDDTTPTFNGKGEPGDTVHIYDNGGPLGSVKVQPDGNWSFTPPPMLEGEHEISVIIEDKAGNQSEPSDPWVVLVDTSAPDAPTIGSIVDDVGSKMGELAPGASTDDTQPTLIGQAEAGATVAIYDNGQKMGEVVAGNDGNWTFTPETALAKGPHSFTATATDAAGNTSAPSSARELVLVNGGDLPTKPMIDAVIDDVGLATGELHSGDVTDDRRPEIGGSSEPDVTVIVYDRGVEIGRTQADSQGRWSFTPDSDLQDGEYSFTAVAENGAGSMSVASEPFDLVVYTGTGPTQVAHLSQMGKDSGYDGHDFVTDNGNAGRLMYGTLSAELVAGQSVQVSIDGGRTWLDAMVDGTRWAAQDLNEHAASWNIQTRVIDQSGKAGYVTNQDVTFGNVAPRTPSAVQLEGTNLRVEFSSANAVVGERIAVIDDNGTHRFEYVLTEQDIATGSVTLDVGEVSSASVALVDLAGNLSGFASTGGATPGVNMVVTGDVSEIYGQNRDNIFTVDDVNVLNSVKVIEGNAGVDTLKLTGADQVLDLSAWKGRFSSVEVIDITGSGNNTLKISLGDVLDQGHRGAFINDDSVQLAVKGNAGDVVMLSDLLPNGMDVGDWENLGEVISAGVSYDVYHHTGLEAEILVQQGVDVQLH